MFVPSVADAFRKTPVKVACGIGPNVMAARDEACRAWLAQNGYIPAQRNFPTTMYHWQYLSSLLFPELC